MLHKNLDLSGIDIKWGKETLIDFTKEEAESLSLKMQETAEKFKNSTESLVSVEEILDDLLPKLTSREAVVLLTFYITSEIRSMGNPIKRRVITIPSSRLNNDKPN